MNKAAKIIILILVLGGIIAGIILLKNITEKNSRVPANDPYTVGNTTGNLYNKGLYAEAPDGKVYFANPYDMNNIYVMNADQSDCHKFVTGNTSFINIAGDYIYYYTSTAGENTGLGYVLNGKGFFRTDKTGKKTYTMAKATTDSMMLVGDNIYYSAFEEDDLKEDSALVTIKSTTTNNENEQYVIDQHIKLGGYNQGIIYYGGMVGDHHLYAYDTLTGSSTLVRDDINVYLPTYYQGRIYYLDLDDEYKLRYINLSSGDIVTLVEDRIDTYNLYNGIIYYQTVGSGNEGYALKRIDTDGNNDTLIKNGVFVNINCTSTYTYFTEFGNDLPVYMIRTVGGTEVTTFDAAGKVVVDEMQKK